MVGQRFEVFFGTMDAWYFEITDERVNNDGFFLVEFIENMKGCIRSKRALAFRDGSVDFWEMPNGKYVYYNTFFVLPDDFKEYALGVYKEYLTKQIDIINGEIEKVNGFKWPK